MLDKIVSFAAPTDLKSKGFSKNFLSKNHKTFGNGLNGFMVLPFFLALKDRLLAYTKHKGIGKKQ